MSWCLKRGKDAVIKKYWIVFGIVNDDLEFEATSARTRSTLKTVYPEDGETQDEFMDRLWQFAMDN